MFKKFPNYGGPNESLTPNQELVYDNKVSKQIGKKLTEDDFSDVYSAKEIADDKQGIKNLKKDFDVPTMQSEILEAIFLEQIEKSEYFGDAEYYTIETVKHDDYKNHTDFVIEFNNNGKPVRIAIDVTVGDKWTAEGKYEKIIKELNFYKGTTIKYFQSEIDPDEKGQINGLPSAVLMMSKENLSALCDLVAKSIKGEEGANKNLAKLHLKFSVIEELLSQFNQQIAYLEKKNNTRSKVYNSLIEARELISGILENIKNSGGADESIHKTIVVEKIKPHALN